MLVLLKLGQYLKILATTRLFLEQQGVSSVHIKTFMNSYVWDPSAHSLVVNEETHFSLQI